MFAHELYKKILLMHITRATRKYTYHTRNMRNPVKSNAEDLHTVAETSNRSKTYSQLVLHILQYGTRHRIAASDGNAVFRLKTSLDIIVKKIITKNYSMTWAFGRKRCQTYIELAYG